MGVLDEIKAWLTANTRTGKVAHARSNVRKTQAKYEQRSTQGSTANVRPSSGSQKIHYLDKKEIQRAFAAKEHSPKIRSTATSTYTPNINSTSTALGTVGKKTQEGFKTRRTEYETDKARRDKEAEYLKKRIDAKYGGDDLRTKQRIKSGEWWYDPDVAMYDVLKHPMAESFGRGALSGATFGLSELAAQKLPKNNRMDEAERVYQENKNNMAEFAGEMTGALAGFGLTGDMSKAALSKAFPRISSKLGGAATEYLASRPAIMEAATREAARKLGATATEAEIAQFARARAAKLVAALGEDMAINLTTGLSSDLSHALIDSDDPASFAKNMGLNAAMNVGLGGVASALPALRSGNDYADDVLRAIGDQRSANSVAGDGLTMAKDANIDKELSDLADNVNMVDDTVVPFESGDSYEDWLDQVGAEQANNAPINTTNDDVIPFASEPTSSTRKLKDYKKGKQAQTAARDREIEELRQQVADLQAQVNGAKATKGTKGKRGAKTVESKTVDTSETAKRNAEIEKAKVENYKKRVEATGGEHFPKKGKGKGVGKQSNPAQARVNIVEEAAPKPVNTSKLKDKSVKSLKNSEKEFSKQLSDIDAQIKKAKKSKPTTPAELKKLQDKRDYIANYLDDVRAELKSRPQDSTKEAYKEAVESGAVKEAKATKTKGGKSSTTSEAEMTEAELEERITNYTKGKQNEPKAVESEPTKPKKERKGKKAETPKAVEEVPAASESALETGGKVASANGTHIDLDKIKNKSDKRLQSGVNSWQKNIDDLELQIKGLNGKTDDASKKALERAKKDLEDAKLRRDYHAKELERRKAASTKEAYKEAVEKGNVKSEAETKAKSNGKAKTTEAKVEEAPKAEKAAEAPKAETEVVEEGAKKERKKFAEKIKDMDDEQLNNKLKKIEKGLKEKEGKVNSSKYASQYEQDKLQRDYADALARKRLVEDEIKARKLAHKPTKNEKLRDEAKHEVERIKSDLDYFKKNGRNTTALEAELKEAEDKLADLEKRVAKADRQRERTLERKEAIRRENEAEVAAKVEASKPKEMKFDFNDSGESWGTTKDGKLFVDLMVEDKNGKKSIHREFFNDTPDNRKLAESYFKNYNSEATAARAEKSKAKAIEKAQKGKGKPKKNPPSPRSNS